MTKFTIWNANSKTENQKIAKKYPYFLFIENLISINHNIISIRDFWRDHINTDNIENRIKVVLYFFVLLDLNSLWIIYLSIR